MPMTKMQSVRLLKRAKAVLVKQAMLRKKLSK